MSKELGRILHIPARVATATAIVATLNLATEIHDNNRYVPINFELHISHHEEPDRPEYIIVECEPQQILGNTDVNLVEESYSALPRPDRFTDLYVDDRFTKEEGIHPYRVKRDELFDFRGEIELRLNEETILNATPKAYIATAEIKKSKLKPGENLIDCSIHTTQGRDYSSRETIINTP